MKMLTKAIENKMPKLYSTEKIATEDKKVMVRYFSIASNWTWYAVEGERQADGDFMFFGLVCGQEKEWGYFSLREIESAKWHGIPAVERDLYFGTEKIKNIRGLN